MNSPFSPVPAVECLEQNSLDGTTLDTLNGMTTASKSLPNESETDPSTTPPSSVISEHSLIKGTPEAIREWLMWSQQGSHASPSASAVTSEEKTTLATCGQQLPQSFAKYDPELHGWRTYQRCLLTGISDEYSQTWPNWGWMLDGECWELERLAGSVPAKGYGYLLLCPTAQCEKAWTFKNIQPLIRKNHADGNIQEQSARCFHKMVSPESNEIVMRWPEGGSDCEPLGMDKIQYWQQLHSEAFAALDALLSKTRKNSI